MQRAHARTVVSAPHPRHVQGCTHVCQIEYTTFNVRIYIQKMKACPGGHEATLCFENDSASKFREWLRGASRAQSVALTRDNHRPSVPELCTVQLNG